MNNNSQPYVLRRIADFRTLELYDLQWDAAGNFGSITSFDPDETAVADNLFFETQGNVTSQSYPVNKVNEIHTSHPELSIPIMGNPTRLNASVHIELTPIHDVVEFEESRWDSEDEVFYYHSDHLGSASWITDGLGVTVQHLQYLPFGEPFVNQRAAGSLYDERFTFTGKAPRKGMRIPLNKIKYNEQRDEETGFSYFGARYMDHELMTMWLSVDPMSDKYPGISPYAYCAWNPIRITDPNGDSLRLEGTAEQRRKVLDYLHQYSHLTFQCDEKGYITLNTDLPGSEIINHSDLYIANMIKDDINIAVIEIMETDYVASKGVRMQKDNPTLFGGTEDYPKDGNYETGRVEGKHFLNINLLGVICGNDSESKTYPGRIIMHEFSEGFEGCKLVRELQRPLTMSQKDYFWSHCRANNHVWGEFTPSRDNGKIKLRSEYIGK